MTNIMHQKIWMLMRSSNFHGYLRTTSGYPLTLTDCMAAYPASLAVSGNTVQDGTPTPDNPVDIQGVGELTENGYKVPLVLSGKNLADIKNVTKYDGKVYPYKTDNGYILTSGNNTRISHIPCKLKAGIKYTASYKAKFLSDTTSPIRLYLPGMEQYLRWGVFTPKSDVTKIGVYLSEIGEGIQAEITEVQVTEGTTVTNYEPYHEPQTFPIYTDSPLYGNGDISDTVELDVADKKATLTQWYGVVSFDGSESWNVDTNYQRYMLKITNSAQCDTTHGFAASNYLKLSIQFGTAMGTINEFTVNIGNIYIRTDGTQTLDEFKTWLSELYAAGTPLTVVYQLAAPVVTDISDKIDWSSIPKLWSGTVVITADTTVSPSEMNAMWYAKTPGDAILGDMLLGVQLLT